MATPDPAGALSEVDDFTVEEVANALAWLSWYGHPKGYDYFKRVNDFIVRRLSESLSRAGDGPVAAHPQAAAQGVTDEMVIAALNAWFGDVGGVNDSEVKPDHPLFIDMRAALTAALEAK